MMPGGFEDIAEGDAAFAAGVVALAMGHSVDAGDEDARVCSNGAAAMDSQKNFKRKMRSVQSKFLKDYDLEGTQFLVVVKRPGFDAEHFTIGSTVRFYSLHSSTALASLLTDLSLQMSSCVRVIDPAKQVNNWFDALQSVPREIGARIGKDLSDPRNQLLPPAVVPLKDECTDDIMNDLTDSKGGGTFDERRATLRSIASRLAVLVGMKLETVRTEVPGPQADGKIQVKVELVGTPHPSWPQHVPWKPITALTLEGLRDLVVHLRNEVEAKKLWKTGEHSNRNCGDDSSQHPRITVAPIARPSKRKNGDSDADGDDEGNGENDVADTSAPVRDAVQAPAPSYAPHVPFAAAHPMYGNPMYGAVGYPQQQQLGRQTFADSAAYYGAGAGAGAGGGGAYAYNQYHPYANRFAPGVIMPQPQPQPQSQPPPLPPPQLLPMPQQLTQSEPAVVADEQLQVNGDEPSPSPSGGSSPQFAAPQSQSQSQSRRITRSRAMASDGV